MKQITSRQNPEIIAIAQLADAKQRYKQQRFVAEGARTVSTLLEHKTALIQLYATQELVAAAQKLAAEKVTLVSDHVMEKISQASTPSGILGVFQLPQLPAYAELTAGLVLANITDPGNMGTLIRSSAAFDARSVVVVGGTDPWSAKVVQASAGTIAQVKIFKWTWEELMAHKDDFTLCALTVYGGKKLEVLKAKKSLLVVGNEASGIPEAWIKDCDQMITLPTSKSVESLNAAVAGSIALYLMFQQ